MSSQQFAFLSQPPPLPKKRVIPAALPIPSYAPPAIPVSVTSPGPLVVRRRSKSGSYAHIQAWASQIQPGSPAPCSPCSSPIRRPSISSITRRRPSIGHGRAHSGSFNHLVHNPTPRSVSAASATSPTTNYNAEYPDLTAMGYTTVFIHFDKTPTTPSPFRPLAQRTPLTSEVFANIPIPPIPSPQGKPAKKVGMKRFRSLSILKPKKASSTSKVPASPTKSAKSSGPAPAKRTKPKHAHAKLPPPPSLANELALMQFADGGSMESHVKRVMEGQAKAAAPAGSSKTQAAQGVATVYRDAQGGLWWDEDEQMEYVHLLEGTDSKADGDVEMEWEEFQDSPSPKSTAVKPLTHPAVSSLVGSSLARRDSSTSNTTSSSLSPSNLLPLPENEPPTSFTSGIPSDRVLSSTRIGNTGMSVLSLPSRPRRKVPHLMREPGTMSYVVGMEAFGPRSPKSPKSPRFPKSPRSPCGKFPASMTISKKTRHRPAPLKLAQSAHVRANAKVAMSLEKKEKDARKEFLDDSFVPPAPAVAVPTATTSTTTQPTRLPNRPPLPRLPAHPAHKPLDKAVVAPWTQLEPPLAPGTSSSSSTPRTSGETRTSSETQTSQSSQPKSVRLLGMFGRK